MESHFVEKHSGGYYFSSEEAYVIQECGEDFGNGDNILFTYDDEMEDEPLKSLGEYLTRNLVFTRDDLLKKLNYYHIEQIGVYAAVTEVKCDSIYEIDTNKDILKMLLEEKKIDKDMYDKLIGFLNFKLQQQLDFIKGTDKISLAVKYNNVKKKEK